MSFKDNFLNLLNLTKSIFSNNLTSQKNVPSSNNNQQDSNYSQGNEREKNSMKKDESDGENDKNIYDFLTKDIINSINDIFTEPNNNSKNEPKKETMQNKSEPFKDKKDSPKQKNSGVNNIKFEEKETKNEFSFNFGLNKFSDFLKNNNLFGNKDESAQNNEKNNNNWNFNMSPSKIFNIDDKNNQQNNNGKNNNGDNITVENKETTSVKNESFKLNLGNANNNNKGFSEKQESFDNNSSKQKFNFFPNLNNYINFEFKSNNKQTQNNYTENNFKNKDNKVMTSFFEQKSSDNKFNLNNFNLSNIKLNFESKETKQQQTSIINNSNNNNDSNIYVNNKFTFFNNNINLVNPINQNINVNFESHDSTTNNNSTISLGKYIDNLDQEKYLITMFGKPGWICRLCNNFNFKSRNICNRCNAIKAPRTKEEIKEKEEFDKMMKKRIKEKKTDWLCLNCQNINYSFRKNCNRCGIERKKEFPPIFYQSNQNQNISEKNNNAKNVDENEDIKNNVDKNN